MGKNIPTFAKMKAGRAIGSILLAWLVLMSSTSFIVGIHLCMGGVENVSFMAHADACEMEKQQPPCHQSAPEPCCADETVIHDSSDFKSALSSLEIGQFFVDVKRPPVPISDVVPESTTPSFTAYKSPLRSCDLVIQHRVLLI